MRCPSSRLARADEIALQISQLSADAVRSGLEYVNQTRDKSWDEAGRIGREIRRVVMASPDFRKASGRF